MGQGDPRPVDGGGGGPVPAGQEAQELPAGPLPQPPQLVRGARGAGASGGPHRPRGDAVRGAELPAVLPPPSDNESVRDRVRGVGGCAGPG